MHVDVGWLHAASKLRQIIGLSYGVRFARSTTLIELKPAQLDRANITVSITVGAEFAPRAGSLGFKACCTPAMVCTQLSSTTVATTPQQGTMS